MMSAGILRNVELGTLCDTLGPFGLGASNMPLYLLQLLHLSHQHKFRGWKERKKNRHEMNNHGRN